MRPIIAAVALSATLFASGCLHARPATAVQVQPRAMQAREAAIAQVKVDEVLGLLKENPELLFLDVRQPEEYAEGRAPGAVLRPLPDLPRWAAKLDKQAPVMVMCRSGHRSMQAAKALVGMGFTHVTNVQGGMLAWEAAGLPVEK